MYLHKDQVEQLLKPIADSRVMDLRGMSYVAQHDIRAHMNRIFGFARWSTDVLETVFLFEDQDEKTSRWRVGYRATVKVTVHAADGTELAHYTDSHAGSCAPQPVKGDAHGLALTSVVSTAFKRACTNLGDQFGLSLYEKGSRAAIVKGTLVGTDSSDVPEVPVTHGEESPSESDGPTEAQVELQKRTDDVDATDHEAMLDQLRKLWGEKDDAARILGVASFKVEWSERLDDTTLFNGTEMSFAKIADGVATDGMIK